MKRSLIPVWSGLILFLVAFTLPAAAAQEATGVTAEAVGQANLRAYFDIEAVKIGEIFAGTPYPVIGRSEFYPWLLLGDPATLQPMGWVFAELVTVRGNISQVPFSTQNLSAGPTATPPAITTTPAPNMPTTTPTAAFAVSGVVRGEINIRYGPGVDYPRIGTAVEGDRFEITGWHTQFPWAQIRYPDAPNGFGWVAIDLLDITGDLYRLPAISQVRFDLPTLTPTPPVVQSSSLPGAAEIPLSAEFQALADRLWNMILSAGFEPETSRTGALFLMDLQTGEAVTFGNHIAFSGTSINKIGILAALYHLLETPPNSDMAVNIANTMICSENAATNALLSIIGGGDEYLGADRVTDFLWQLGLKDTFLTAPYVLDPNNIPEPPRPIRYPKTSVDQVRANPDPSNQMTVDEMGWLLGSVYQCAYNTSGPLLQTFGAAFDPRECRQMLHVMSSNTVDALLKAGVPEGTRVAHKHGWINDTHGNAAVIFTPGGDYVLVVMLHQPTWLNFQESLPLIAEVSRAVYNYYNPQAPLEEIREGFIPETEACNFRGSPLINDLMSGTFNP